MLRQILTQTFFRCKSTRSLNIFDLLGLRLTNDLEPEMTLMPEFKPGEFPDLPHIKSAEIRTKVLTHRSFYARSAHVFEDHVDDPSPDNEKYEHLGDTVLGLVVTSLLLDMYPCLRVGPSTKIRALMVGNSTLSQISLKYKLPDRLRLHPAQAITLRASANIQADVLESYIGGLYADQGLPAVKAWLIPLFRPYSTLAYTIVRTQHGLPPLPTPSSTPPRPSIKPPWTLIPSPTSSSADLAPEVTTPAPPLTTIGHLSLFNQHVQKAHRAVEWVYSDGGEGEGTKTTPVWLVTVFVDGACLGKGKGGTKKAARNEAAKEGLEGLGIYV